MANRLAHESSPYLRQHAENPVDWYPWGAEAFDAARARDVPVLLSVGYSACHWCHVMAHESFEDPAIAELMNRVFVNVKVDREELPDVDAVYMEAVQALTGRGGWPMTVLLDHDQRPVWGGTYFPPTRRHGTPGFAEVCEALDDLWRTRRDELHDQARQLTEQLVRTAALEPDDAVPTTAALGAAAAALRDRTDPRHGGFGDAPKFPQPSSLRAMLLAHHLEIEGDLLPAIELTLDAMACGGIYDHLGGGFARYATDRAWLVPHFEKMLYDQALLSSTYLRAWQATGEPRYRQVLDETIGYVLRDLQLACGGFASAEDADSEGIEGRFYVWTPAEVRDALGDDLAAEAIAWWGVTDAGHLDGGSILHRPLGGPIERPEHIERARLLLHEARALRVRPGLDDKVVTEWNALMVAALADAAAATGEASWADAAVRAGEHLCTEHRRADGRWLRSWHPDGGPGHLGVAADLAAVVDAMVRLAELTGEARWVAVATETADALVATFGDDERGGFFTTGSDAPSLVARVKDVLDNATPSSTSVGITALLRLGALTGEQRWHDVAVDALRLVAPLVARHPAAVANACASLVLLDPGTVEIVIPGEAAALRAVVTERWRPTAVLAWGESPGTPLWAERAEGAAYVCRSMTCRLPATDPDALRAQLDGT